jgi:thiol-disulfide isomerase/thioredoxin
VTTTKKKAREAREAAALARRRAEEQRRKRMIAAISVFSAVVLVIVVFVAVKLAGDSPKSAATTAAPVDVINAVTTVPAATLDTIGQGGGNQFSVPTPTPGNAVVKADGKPLVLYVGAEYCPYCAAERWAVVEALSRFGTFTGLGQTSSAAGDVYPNTPTLSFHGSTYTSDYITFQGPELYTNQPSGNGYTPLDTLTPQQSTLFGKNNGFPYMNFAGQALVNGASIGDPSIFAGKTQAQVATAMRDPSTPIAKAVGGLANAFTTIICGLTGDKPADVCATPAANAYRDTYRAGN